MSGLVTFRLGEREFATDLGSVREVVRLEGLADLPAMTPPFAGVLDLRGAALPVLDLRAPGEPGRRGDVMVLQRAGEPVGVAVDQVRAVLADGALPVAGAGVDPVLPSYVRQVLRGEAGPVFLVDLEDLLLAYTPAQA